MATFAFNKKTGEQAGASVKPSARSRFLIPFSLVIVGGAIASWSFFSRPQSHNLTLSGRIEGYETDVGTKVGGRIEAVTVREGATVQQGELLARLEDDELQAQLQGAEARLQAAKQQEQNARLQISVLENQVDEASLKVQQAQGDTAGRVDQAAAQVATASAQLEQTKAQVTEAEAQLQLAQQDRDRYQDLVRQGATPQQRLDQANATYKAAAATLNSRRAAVTAAQRQVTAARGQFTQSQSTQLNPEINTTQRDRLHTQLEQARILLASAQSEVANATATRQQVQAQLANLTVNSPINGVVITRTVEPGMVVAPGKVLLTVLDLNTVYLRGFIPEGQIGRVRVGQFAHVSLDSHPDRPLTAKVAAIDTEASFTPENIYFKQDRVQQVFGVRLTLDSPAGLAKPGMPADAEIMMDATE